MKKCQNFHVKIFYKFFEKMASEEHVYKQIQQHLNEMSEINDKMRAFLDEDKNEEKNYKSRMKKQTTIIDKINYTRRSNK